MPVPKMLHFFRTFLCMIFYQNFPEKLNFEFSDITKKLRRIQKFVTVFCRGSMFVRIKTEGSSFKTLGEDIFRDFLKTIDFFFKVKTDKNSYERKSCRIASYTGISNFRRLGSMIKNLGTFEENSVTQVILENKWSVGKSVF